jgi:cysteine desulfurase
MMLVYLDYNATAPVRPEAASAMQEALAEPANPSSVHGFGRAAKKKLEDARAIIAQAVSCWPDEIIFTASGTEANNTALNAFCDKTVFVSAIEHSSLLGVNKTIPVNADGIVDLAALDARLVDNKGALVSVMLANNETGVIQPVTEVAAVCKKHHAVFHCDAVQALGKIPVDFGAIGADMVSLSAHKCGGPVGAAALLVRRGLPFTPLLVGGGQELRRRAGTENVAAVCGFARAMERIDFAAMKKLRGWLDAMEKQMTVGGATVFGRNAARLPNTSCVSMPGVSNEVQVMDFDLKGFAVSAGSACSSGRIEPSHVLTAMGVSNKDAATAIRISGGWATAETEITAFTEAWKSTCERLARAA